MPLLGKSPRVWLVPSAPAGGLSSPAADCCRDSITSSAPRRPVHASAPHLFRTCAKYRQRPSLGVAPPEVAPLKVHTRGNTPPRLAPLHHRNPHRRQLCLEGDSGERLGQDVCRHLRGRCPAHDQCLVTDFLTQKVIGDVDMPRRRPSPPSKQPSTRRCARPCKRSKGRCSGRPLRCRHAQSTVRTPQGRTLSRIRRIRRKRRGASAARTSATPCSCLWITGALCGRFIWEMAATSHSLRGSSPHGRLHRQPAPADKLVIRPKDNPRVLRVVGHLPRDLRACRAVRH